MYILFQRRHTLVFDKTELSGERNETEGSRNEEMKKWKMVRERKREVREREAGGTAPKALQKGENERY